MNQACRSQECLPEILDDIFQRSHARVPFVFAADKIPRSSLGEGLSEHVFRCLVMLSPFPSVAPIFRVDFPMLVGISLPFLEATQLLGFADVNVEFDEKGSVVHNLTLEFQNLAISALPFLVRGKTFDT